MTSTEKTSSWTVLTVSDVPSRQTLPFSAMKRDNDRGARTSNRAVGPQGSSQAVIRVRRTMVATPSTWPVTIWPPSSSPILSERSRFTRVPGPHSPRVVRGRAFRLLHRLEPGPVVARAERDHRQAWPPQAMEAPSVIVAGS